MMNIYDGNSHVRRMLEADASGRPFRSLSMDVVTNGAVNVYVWDSMGGNARRRAIYPAYKADRKPMGEDIFTARRAAYSARRYANVSAYSGSSSDS